MRTALIDPTPSDRRADSTLADVELLTRTRDGDDDAYAVLYARHRDAAERLARQLCGRGAAADDLVADAFAAILAALRNGAGPSEAFRPYLLTTVRHRAYRRARSTEDPVDPAEDGALDGVVFDDDGDDQRLMADAYRSLPERWQLVLWHTEVEGQRPAEVAPLVGLSPHATAALAHRAREGLREAYLQAHLHSDTPAGCASTVGRLGALVRGNLGTRDATKAEGHLAGCTRCRHLRDELLGINKALRTVIGPLVLGAAAAGYLGRQGSSGSAAAAATWRAGGLARRAATLAAGVVLLVGLLVLRADRPGSAPATAGVDAPSDALAAAAAARPPSDDPIASGAGLDLPGGVTVHRVVTTACADRFGVALTAAPGTAGDTDPAPSEATVLTAVLVRDGSTPLRALGLAVDDAVTRVTGPALGTLRTLTATVAATSLDGATVPGPTPAGACVSAPAHTLLAPAGAWGLLVTYLPSGATGLDDLRAALLEQPFALLGPTTRAAVHQARAAAADVLADLPALGPSVLGVQDQIAALLGPAAGGGPTGVDGAGGGTDDPGADPGLGGVIGGAGPAPTPTLTPPLSVPPLPSIPGLPDLPGITVPPVTLPPLGLP
ncbi:MAG: sigma-70 family RNA polymerase sigma factor [Acidimicrobiales bacterium]|nr:sigma-70 family RNA polymerase sigma factor [Acidimicrobiales bacterium]